MGLKLTEIKIDALKLHQLNKKKSEKQKEEYFKKKNLSFFNKKYTHLILVVYRLSRENKDTWEF